MKLAENIDKVIATLDGIGFDVGDYRVSLYRAILVVLVSVAVFFAGRIGNFLIRRFFRRLARLDATQQVLGEKLVGIALWIGLILLAIDFLGIDFTTLAVFSGAMGLAIGFGMQKTFGNLISGIILLMDRSIKPGDVIAVNDGGARTVGQVNRIGIRAVSVITRDRIEYLIPNELLMTSQVENWSFSSRDVRVKVPVGVAYDSDMDLVERLLLESANSLPRVLGRRAPEVWLQAFGDNAVQFEVQLWIEDPEEGLGNLRSDLLKEVLKRFRKHKIAIPYPQTDLHVKEWPKGTKFS